MLKKTNYHLIFFLFTGIISLLIILLQWVLPFTIHQDIWKILAFIAISYYIIGVLSNWLLKTAPDNLIQVKMLGMVLRTLASLSFIGIVVFMGLENILLFISDFFVLFLFYLVFDIYSFLSNLRPISK